MAINFNISPKGKMLFVKASGEDENIEEVKEYAQAILESAFQNESNIILCDERELIYKLSVIDTFQLAEFVSQNCPLIFKVAIVTNTDNIKDINFYETVVTNRGMRLKVFNQIQEAEDWLFST